MTPPPSPSSHTVMRWMNRALNVLLVVAALFWALNAWFEHQHNPETVQSEAQAAFAPESGLAGASITIQTLSGEAFASLVEQSPMPVAAFFYASWCPYCQKMFPVLTALEQAAAGKYRIVFISIDEERDELHRYLQQHPVPEGTLAYHLIDGESRRQVTAYLAKKDLQFKGSIPYMAFFQKGKPLAQFSGLVAEEKLRSTFFELANSSPHNSPVPTSTPTP